MKTKDDNLDRNVSTNLMNFVISLLIIFGIVMFVMYRIEHNDAEELREKVKLIEAANLQMQKEFENYIDFGVAEVPESYIDYEEMCAEERYNEGYREGHNDVLRQIWDVLEDIEWEEDWEDIDDIDDIDIED